MKNVIIGGAFLIGAYFLYNKYGKKKSTVISDNSSNGESEITDKNIRTITSDDQLQELPIVNSRPVKMMSPSVRKKSQFMRPTASVGETRVEAPKSFSNFLQADGYYNASKEGYANVSTEGFF